MKTGWYGAVADSIDLFLETISKLDIKCDIYNQIVIENKVVNLNTACQLERTAIKDIGVCTVWYEWKTPQATLAINRLRYPQFYFNFWEASISAATFFKACNLRRTFSADLPRDVKQRILAPV